MWNVEFMIMLGISGATGMATKVLNYVLKAIPGKHSIGSLQNTVIFGTSHITPKALPSET